jgi:hypothetical protein
MRLRPGGFCGGTAVENRRTRQANSGNSSGLQKISAIIPHVSTVNEFTMRKAIAN